MPVTRTDATTRARGRKHDIPAVYEIVEGADRALAAIGLRPGEARLLAIVVGNDGTSFDSRVRDIMRELQTLRGKKVLTPWVAGSRRSSGNARFDVTPETLPKQTDRSFGTENRVDPDAFKPSARSRAILEGIRIAQQDLRDSGGAYNLEQVRVLMGRVSRQRIDRRIKERSLFAVSGPGNRRVYPAIQFNPDGSIIDGLNAVLNALPTQNGWAVLNFLLHPDRRLDGRKPIDLLKAGQAGLVVEAARQMGEQGA